MALGDNNHAQPEGFTAQSFANLQKCAVRMQVLVKFLTHLEQTRAPRRVLQRLSQDHVGACPPSLLAWIWLGEPDVRDRHPVRIGSHAEADRPLHGPRGPGAHAQARW